MKEKEINYYDQIFSVLTVSGKLRCSVGVLQSMTLHPLAEKVIEESLAANLLVFSDEDFLLGLSILHEISNETLECIVKEGFVKESRMSVDKLEQFALRYIKAEIRWEDTIFTKKSYVKFAWKHHKNLHYPEVNIACMPDMKVVDIERQIARTKNHGYLEVIGKVLNLRGVITKHTYTLNNGTHVLIINDHIYNEGKRQWIGGAVPKLGPGIVELEERLNYIGGGDPYSSKTPISLKDFLSDY